MGNELFGKKIGIVGLGAIGKELAKRTPFLGMETYVYDVSMDYQFLDGKELSVLDCVEDVFKTCDIVSLHVPLTESTKGLISVELFNQSLN